MKKNIIALISIVICIFICGFSEANNTEGCSEKTQIQIQQPEKIVTVQLNSMKIDSQEFGKGRLSDLVKSMESTILLDEEEANLIQKGDIYSVVIFIYEDGTKNIFHFFEESGEWYAETEDGSIYKNAEFIEDYIHMEVGTAHMRLRIPPELLKIRLDMEQQFEESGTMVDFAFFVASYMYNTGKTEDEAISHVRESMLDEMKLYQYAVQEGYGISDEELTKLMELEISDITSADDFAEYEKIYEEAGTTLEQSYEKNKESIRKRAALQNMSKAIYEEFRNGNDTIGDKVCKDTQEYSRTYMSDIVEPAMEEYDLSSFIKELDEAEEFYHENRYGKF